MGEKRKKRLKLHRLFLACFIVYETLALCVVSLMCFAFNDTKDESSEENELSLILCQDLTSNNEDTSSGVLEMATVQYDGYTYGEYDEVSNLFIQPEDLDKEKVSLSNAPIVEYVSEPESVTPVDYSSMTKSQIQQRLDKLASIAKDLESLQETDKQYYKTITNEYANGISHLESGDYVHLYSDEDVALLAYMINVEAGSDEICSDTEQQLVAMVIINRRNQNGIDGNLNNPTIKDIINESGQYGICKYSSSCGRNTVRIDYTDGYIAITNVISGKVMYVAVSDMPNRCVENAKKALNGDVSCPSNVVYQAAFKQGTGVYKSFVHMEYHNTTYFCYG